MVSGVPEFRLKRDRDREIPFRQKGKIKGVANSRLNTNDQLFQPKKKKKNTYSSRLTYMCFYMYMYVFILYIYIYVFVCGCCTNVT